MSGLETGRFKFYKPSDHVVCRPGWAEVRRASVVPGGGIEPPTSGPYALQIMSFANPARAGALPAEPPRRRP